MQLIRYHQSVSVPNPQSRNTGENDLPKSLGLLRLPNRLLFSVSSALPEQSAADMAWGKKLGNKGPLVGLVTDSVGKGLATQA